jgi:hypothetical protein
LYKSRLNRELIEDILQRLGGITEEEKANMLAQHELTDFRQAEEKRRHSPSQLFPVNESYDDQKNWMREKFPSLRHLVEHKKFQEEDRKDAGDRKLRELDLGLQMDRMQADRDRYDNREFENRRDLEEKISGFRESEEGQNLINTLAERQRNRRIAQITGVKPPEMPPLPLSRASGGMTSEDRALLNQLHGGSNKPLEFLQAHGQGETPLVGDMPSQAFEQTYPIQMDTKPYIPDVYYDLSDDYEEF